ncbi:hypothetical protein MASR2M66_26070 [Chloroflexota bacterium]
MGTTPMGSSNRGNGKEGLQGPNWNNRGDDAEEIVPTFKEWISLCQNNPSDTMCPQPPADFGCTAPPMYVNSGSTESFGCHIDHYETIYNYQDLDYLKIGVNGFSIVGNVVLVLAVFHTGGIGIVPALEFYGFTQGVNFIYDILTADNILEPITINLLYDYAPGFSFMANVSEIANERKRVRQDLPIYVPDTPYLGLIKKPIIPGY